MWTVTALRSRMPAWKTLHARFWSRLQFFPCHATRIAGFIPVLLVSAILCFAYFTAVPATLLPLYGRSPTCATFLMLVFHFIYLNVIINYAILVFADPGGVPDDWHVPPPTEETRSSGNVNFPYVHLMRDRAYDGGLRYCRHCRCYKPDRAHHCSVCRRCILRMDHHCVFVNNCVSFLNHKFFLAFVTYAFLGCLFVSISAFPNVKVIVLSPVENYAVTGRAGSEVFETCTLVGYVLCLAFTFALGIFVTFHAFLLARGRTTIELYEAVDPNRGARIAAYDLGAIMNFRKACGNVPLCWLFPTRAHIEGDGLSYERMDTRDYANEV